MWMPRGNSSISVMSSSDFDSTQGSAMVSSETSTGPSRIDSCSSSGGPIKLNDFTVQVSFDNTHNKAAVVPSSPISSTSHEKVEALPHGLEVASATDSTTDHSSADHTETEDQEVDTDQAVSPTIQKWVNESYVETERLKTLGELSNNEIRIDDEFKDETNSQSDFAVHQALEFSLRAVSPNFQRAGSLDGGLSSLDFQTQLTPNENLLVGLGFGGPDLGIPVRFLKSWREQVIKRKITELQSLLSRSRKSLSPTRNPRPYTSKPVQLLKVKETPHLNPSSVVTPDRRKAKEPGAKQQTLVTKLVVKSSDKQFQLEKLKAMRQQLHRSATFSSFSQNVLPISKQLTNENNPQNKGTMSEKKHQKLRGATRANAKDRRWAFGTRVSSLPISLETLPEEDEGRPAFLQNKASSFEFVNDTTSASFSSVTSVNSSTCDVLALEGIEDALPEAKLRFDDLERFQMNGPRIVTSGPPASIDKTDAFLQTGTLGHLCDDNRLLVIKNIIESKDSGFGNDISNGDTPQQSPELQPELSVTKSIRRDEGVEVVDIQDELHPLESQIDGETLRSRDLSEKKGQRDKSDCTLKRMDSCIQCNFLDKDGESDIEYSNAGIQTSPWLESGELSPLYCGDFQSSINDSLSPNVNYGGIIDLDQSDKVSHCVTLLDGNETGMEGTSLVDQDRTSECVSTGLTFPEKINSERRLSRIEELTEINISFQSEEEKCNPSPESRQDSIQTISTSCPSRSSSIINVSDVFNVNEGQHPEHCRKGSSESDLKKQKRKTYKEMLRINGEADLKHGEILIQMSASYQQGKTCSKLTVEEILRKTAQKLELYVTDEDNDDDNDKEDANSIISEGCISHTNSTTNTLSITDEPVHSKVPQPRHILQTYPNSCGNCPNDQLSSIRSRHFFSSNSISSFTDNVKHSENSSGITGSEVSEIASFFNVPLDLDNIEEELNFSLIGSDMNLVVGADDNSSLFHDEDLMMSAVNRSPYFYNNLKDLEYGSSHSPNNKATKSDIIASSSLLSEEKDSISMHSLQMCSEPQLHMVSQDECLNNFSSSLHPSFQSGVFSVPTFVLVSSQNFCFTQTLEIDVPSLPKVESVKLSQLFIALEHNHCVGNSEKKIEEGISVHRCNKYSSKYYFSVEDYSQYFDGISPAFTENDDTVSKRRSLINAHLSAKMYMMHSL